MKVRMRGQMSGTRNGQPWPERGAVVELPDDEAATLCRQGMAEPIRDSDVETAVTPEAELAVVDEPVRRRGRPPRSRDSRP